MIIQGGAFQPNEDTTKRVLIYLRVADPKLKAQRFSNMSACLFSKGFKTTSGGPPDPFSYAVGLNGIEARKRMIECSIKNGDPI